MSIARLMAVGDISLQTENANPFGAVKDILKDGDILIGNLETALSNKPFTVEQAVILKSSPDKAKLLAEAGFDILNLENNHTRDAGEEGYIDTVKALNSLDVKYIDSGKHYRLTKEHTTFAFTSITEKEIANSMAIYTMIVLKMHTDIVVVSLHWGTENVYYPSPSQIVIAHNLIDRGADIIIGHHPHVLQGIERYNGGLIAYSLGNFQFDPVVSQTKDNNSMILSVNLDGGGIVDYKTIPIKIENCCPVPVQQDIGEFIRIISEPIVSGKVNWKFWYSAISKTYLAINLRSFKKRIAKSGWVFIDLVKWLLSPHTLCCIIFYLLNALKRETKV